jgi:hypothetical protein
MRGRFGIALLAAAIAGACGTAGTQVRFEHRQHFRSGVSPSCAACHNIAHERPQPDRLACYVCHGESADELIAKTTLAVEKHVSFSHGKHAAYLDLERGCAQCHGAVARTEPTAPPMDKCLACHRASFDANRCTSCHAGRALARLVPKSFMAHGPSWIRAHGPDAMRSQATCLACHAEAACADCHDTTQALRAEVRNPDAITAGYVHRGDYLTRHAIEARQQPAPCLGCHEPASCDGCHAKRGVSAASVGARSPHPIGWVGNDTQSANFHGRAARHDVAECAACHDQGPGTGCIRCHRVGAVGGTPHRRGSEPPGQKTSAPCRYCHA